MTSRQTKEVHACTPLLASLIPMPIFLFNNQLRNVLVLAKKRGPNLRGSFFFFNRSLACSLFYVIFRSSFCLLKIPGRRKGQCARLHCWKKWIVDFYSKPRMWKPLNLVLFQEVLELYRSTVAILAFSLFLPYFYLFYFFSFHYSLQLNHSHQIAFIFQVLSLISIIGIALCDSTILCELYFSLLFIFLWFLFGWRENEERSRIWELGCRFIYS